MRIIGLTRVRNESEIILDTLEHMGEFCDVIYVYDDLSTDNTIELCESHPKVRKVIRGTNWDRDRARAEFQNRQTIFKYALEDYKPNNDDWFIYMDADERIEFDFNMLKDPTIGGVKMKLFDFYITEEDKHLDYKNRKWMGPEYRIILFMFKVENSLGYFNLDQRECSLKPSTNVITSGYVRHYGKSISIKQWEDTCEYYSKFFPMYSEKWEKRKGKAIHTRSDFDRELIQWEDKKKKKKIVRI